MSLLCADYDEVASEKSNLDVLLEADLLNKEKEKRYWVSWYTEAEEGRLAWKLMRDKSRGKHFRSWLTGQSDGGYDDEGNIKDVWSICADIHAQSEVEVWAKVKKFWPNYEYRFINEIQEDQSLGDRFQ
jgi:hypothetical protein